MTPKECAQKIADDIGVGGNQAAVERIARDVATALKDATKEERRRVKALIDQMKPELKAQALFVIFPTPPQPVEKQWVDMSKSVP